MGATIPDVHGIFAEACRLADIERYDLSAEELVRAIEESVKRYAPTAAGRELRKFILSLRLDDLALATACARGSGRAWGEFYKRYHQYLIDTAGEYDLADQVIAELYGTDGRGKIGNFRGRSSLKTWLHTVAVRVWARRRHRFTTITPLGDALDAVLFLAAAGSACTSAVGAGVGFASDLLQAGTNSESERVRVETASVGRIMS